MSLTAEGSGGNVTRGETSGRVGCVEVDNVLHARHWSLIKAPKEAWDADVFKVPDCVVVSGGGTVRCSRQSDLQAIGMMASSPSTAKADRSATSTGYATDAPAALIWSIAAS